MGVQLLVGVWLSRILKEEKSNRSGKMGRTPCCDKRGLKKGSWTPEEDQILVDYINKNGHGSWRSLPKNAGLILIFLPLLCLVTERNKQQ